MILLPYMSENLLNSNVTNAAARLGMESDHAYRDMPSRSAAILGLAIPSVCMKKLIVKWREKTVISPRTICFRDNPVSKARIRCTFVIPIS
jgi:hypothetical protein